MISLLALLSVCVADLNDFLVCCRVVGIVVEKRARRVVGVTLHAIVAASVNTKTGRIITMFVGRRHCRQ